MKKNEYINFSHYDLDGVVCYILLSHIFDIKRYYCCGYGKIDKKIDEIISGDMFDGLVVSDLSLTRNQYTILSDEIGDLKGFIFFDHHDSTLIELKDIKINGIVNLERSAAALIFYYYKDILKQNTYYNELKKLTYYTDLYDMWNIDTKDFNIGYGLTQLFNHYQWNIFVSRFKFGFKGFRQEEINLIREITREKIKIIKGADTYIFPENDGIILMLPDCDKVINDMTLYHKKYKIHFGISSDLNKVSVRHTLDANLADIFKELFKDNVNILTAGGHKNAGSFIYNTMNKEEIIKDINFIYNKILEDNAFNTIKNG